MSRCEICGKPTTSHEVGDYFICHTCWTEKPEEVDEVKEQAEEDESKSPTGSSDETEGGSSQKDTEDVDIEEIEGQEEKKEKGPQTEEGKELLNKLDEVESKEDLYLFYERYQEKLDRSLDEDPEGNKFWKIKDDVTEELCETMFGFARKEGWPFVLEMIDKYGPENSGVVTNVPIENVTDMMIISTRENEGVEEIPVEALEYLTGFSDASDVEWEDSFACGWGFDHPEFDFKDVLEEDLKEGNDLWASAILERAFYADQVKAAPILIDFLERDDISDKDKMALVQAVTFFTDEKHWKLSSDSPRYWDWKEELDYRSFEWDEDVEDSLKEVIEEELADYIESNQSEDMDVFKRTELNLPAQKCDFSKDWSFIDLQI
ncbi:MAG: hypothetical protein ACOC8Y_06055 [Candidatus Natronoplasma sp.]